MGVLLEVEEIDVGKEEELVSTWDSEEEAGSILAVGEAEDSGEELVSTPEEVTDKVLAVARDSGEELVSTPEEELVGTPEEVTDKVLAVGRELARMFAVEALVAEFLEATGSLAGEDEEAVGSSLVLDH